MNSTLHAMFLDFEKTFDTIHCEPLWKIMYHYGIPQKKVNVIKALYIGVPCQMVCSSSKVADNINITTGVKQVRILSPFLFIQAMDWLMKQITKDM